MPRGYRDTTDYFEMWQEDYESMLDTMIRNMADDIKAGYDYFGKSITGQREDIEAYKAKHDEALMNLANMDEAKANRWCKMDLIRRGAISI